MEQKRVLLIGGSGQLGRCIMDQLSHFPEVQIANPPRDDLDIANHVQVKRWMSNPHVTYDAIINTAAMHDLQACEDNFDAAFKVNALGVQNLLDRRPEGCHLYHISTDYVFDQWHLGNPTGSIDSGQPPKPLNAYGRTKRAGEILAMNAKRTTVIRTASLWSKYGSTGKGDRNFVLNMVARATDPDSTAAIAVVNDVIMSPTYAPHLARALLFMVSRGITPFVTHLVSDGDPVSWYQFAKAIFITGDYESALKRLVPCESEDGGIPRPRYSALANDSTQIRMGTWQSALDSFFDERAKEQPE